MACLLVGSAWQLMPVQKLLGSDMSILQVFETGSIHCVVFS
jgi:hypothetical protein